MLQLEICFKMPYYLSKNMHTYLSHAKVGQAGTALPSKIGGTVDTYEQVPSSTFIQDMCG